MGKRYRYFLVILILILVASASVLVYVLPREKLQIDRWYTIGRAPKIYPDYSGVTIPPNISPLNFVVREEGTYYFVKIYAKQGKAIEIFSSKPKIIIPVKSWRQLVDKNKAGPLYFDIFVKGRDGQWNRFAPIENTISSEPIDGYLVYRKIHPGHSRWSDIGIYQRNLHNYNESPILDNKFFKHGCLNCHTFANNRPDKMLIGIRSKHYGSSAILVEDNTVRKIGAKFGYCSWHPSGKLAAFSINKIRQFFHSARSEVRDVIDLDSLLAYYLVDSKTIKTSPHFSRKDRLETYPTWSPDGKYLYFCSAPVVWSDLSRPFQRDIFPPPEYAQVKYDLVRISYDIQQDKWGEIETIVSAKNNGLCSQLPRISPDGRWLLFCMCNYSSFPVYQQSSDLYIIDLKAAEQTGKYEYRRLAINSEQSESWHSWSSNSRWIAFSSKKQSGVFTRIYFSYVDETGKAHKPVLMPQKDPTFYDSCLKTYSVPELIIGPVEITGEKLARVVRSSHKIDVEMPITMATPKVGIAPGEEQRWQERE